MTTTLETGCDAGAGRGSASGVGVSMLRSVASAAGESGSVTSYFARAFKSVSGSLGASFVYGSYRDGAVDVDESWGEGTGGWREAASGMVLGVISSGDRIVRLYRGSDGVSVLGVCCGIESGPGRVVGAIAAFFACDGDDSGSHASLVDRVDGMCVALVAGSALVSGAGGGRSGQGSMSAGAAHDAVVRSSDYRSIHQLAFAITNNLRARVDADVVALGVPRGKTVRLLSISGMDEVKPRSPGALPIRQAMEEACDFGRAICYQLDDTWSGTRVTTGHRLHRAWHESTGGGAVLSVPLRVGDELVAVVSVKRAASRAFSIDEVESIASTVEPFAAGFDLVGRASRGLAAHAGASVGSCARWCVRRGGWGRKAVLVGLLGLAAWVGFGTVEHRVTVPATVSAPGSMVLTAPFSGRLERMLVEPGSTVSAGEVLAEMDTRSLELELASLVSQAEGLRVEVEQSVAAGDMSAAVRADAQLGVVRADIASVRSRLADATIVAPFDGVVLGAEGEDRVGEVFGLGASVLRVAPLGSMELTLEVPEWASVWVRAGGAGAFVPSARPGSRSRIEVVGIDPAASVVDGRNVVLADASLGEAEAWVLPGMSGTARLEFGERRVWWVGLNRLIDAARMRLWL